MSAFSSSYEDGRNVRPSRKASVRLLRLTAAPYGSTTNQIPPEPSPLACPSALSPEYR